MKNKSSLQYASVVCTLITLLLCAHSAPAYGYAVTKTDPPYNSEIHWPTQGAGFYINTAGFPSGSLQAIEHAMDTWTAVTTSNFSFAYKGSTSSDAYPKNDGMNIICFGAFGSGYESTLAENTFFYNPQTGMLSDSDIKFNSAFTWATNSTPAAYDVQTLALHELGHALSLKDLYDSGDTQKVMYGQCSVGEIKRSLTQDDKNGITYLYPGGSVSTTTTTISLPGVQCPAETVLGQDNPDLESLRAFRDGFLARSAAGRRLIQIYYDNAERINAALACNPVLRDAARKFFESFALLVTKME
jgi:hypothetical protein